MAISFLRHLIASLSDLTPFWMFSIKDLLKIDSRASCEVVFLKSAKNLLFAKRYVHKRLARNSSSCANDTSNSRSYGAEDNYRCNRVLKHLSDCVFHVFFSFQKYK